MNDFIIVRSQQNLTTNKYSRCHQYFIYQVAALALETNSDYEFYIVMHAVLNLHATINGVRRDRPYPQDAPCHEHWTTAEMRLTNAIHYMCDQLA